MRRAGLPDTGVLSLVTHPGIQAEARACRAWMEDLMTTDCEVVIPEIRDYELRPGDGGEWGTGDGCYFECAASDEDG